MMNGINGLFCQGLDLVCKKAVTVFCRLVKELSGTMHQAGDQFQEGLTKPIEGGII